MVARSIIAVIFAVVAIYIYVALTSETLTVPDLEEKWWGPGEPGIEDTAIKPFKINVSEKDHQDLQQRLANTLPFQPPLEGAKQNYGMNTNLLTKIVDFWKTKYNWREREKFLNKFPQFKTNIQGLNIHFIHVKPTKTHALKVVPMLLLHGWPGSVREFYELIPMLTTPQPGRDYIFEVIVPSLPGYGFSDGAVRPGLDVSHMAVIFKNLMKRLGFDKYYIQGGDWGGVVVQNMAILFPEYIYGVHTNGCFLKTPSVNLKLWLGSYFPSLITSDPEEQEIMFPFSKTFSSWMIESGYMHLHATKPDTVGVALRDSPVGIAAYILEKFSTWTNPIYTNLEDGGLTKSYTYEKLLDNVMIYWISRSITTSARLYAEFFSKDATNIALDKLPVKIPSACMKFRNDLIYLSDSLLKDKYHQLIQSEKCDGGHFASFEVPDIMAKDIFKFVEKVEKLKETV